MKRFLAEFSEAVRIALEELGHHKTRGALTALGVIIGVVAVSLMGTAVSGIDKGFKDSLDMIGTDVFFVQRFPWQEVGEDWRLYNQRERFTFENADRMNELIAETGSENLELAVAQRERYRTIRQGRNVIENAETITTTAEFPRVSAAQVEKGRFFTQTESASGARVVVLGSEIAESLFPNMDPLGKTVVVSSVPFNVIGVFKPQGNFLGIFSQDNRLVLPDKALSTNRWENRNVSLVIKMRQGAEKAAAMSEIEGLMRRVRGLLPEQVNDFEINQTEMLEKQIGPVKKGISIAGLGITALSLIVGAIGIMNITFVAVRERTREIGTRRALGAPQRAILIQFLTEAVMISVLGGMIGLALTWLIQAAVKQAMPNFPLVFSYTLLLVAMTISIIVGILSGFVPAWLASRLDPAEALRHD